MSFILAFLLITSPFIGHGDPTIIINKQTNQLAFIQYGKIISTYKVATGKTTDLTPEGTFTVIVKAKDPYYRKKNIPGGSPLNPLGSRWIGFDANNTDGRTFGIHGTNNPASIGKHVSQGCVRMLNKHVEKLFEQVPIGTTVKIVKSKKTFKQLMKLTNQRMQSQQVLS